MVDVLNFSIVVDGFAWDSVAFMMRLEREVNLQTKFFPYLA